ncbi:hypothetical protein PCYB_007400 [Plasmodium cynomolgi strain B]|uniref:CYIR protein n=1 Tax=Plasmodium cynomolgi (strain B) TaxID=1120755 RepID=K6UFF1_PLACD|nr:hypothetical protein PCYB_007400 [Plasmodium cynomolgi strain B]GAB69991.1 hypothetical protein PCYB_007400 [Plasmodium cynomolgi strain B]
MDMESDDLQYYYRCNSINLLRYLDKNSLSNIPDPKYDECILLNYWVYSKIVKIFHSDKSSIIDNPFAALLRIWNEIIDNQPDKPSYIKCRPDSGTIMKHDWRKRKELYDYYVNYDTLFNTAQGYPQKCQEYYEKIKKMQNIFDYFEEHCEKYSHLCPEIYKDCKSYNPKSILEKIKCHATIIGTSGSISEDNSLLQGRGSTEVHPERADDFKLHIIDAFTAQSDTHIDSGNSGIGTKVTHSILGAAPVLLTGTMLYRVCIYFVNIYHYSTNM